MTYFVYQQKKDTSLAAVAYAGNAAFFLDNDGNAYSSLSDDKFKRLHNKMAFSQIAAGQTTQPFLVINTTKAGYFTKEGDFVEQEDMEFSHEFVVLMTQDIKTKTWTTTDLTWVEGELVSLGASSHFVHFSFNGKLEEEDNLVLAAETTD